MNIDMPPQIGRVTSAADYEKAIAQIHHHFRQGDTYQVNYTVQLKQKLNANPFAPSTIVLLEHGRRYSMYVVNNTRCQWFPWAQSSFLSKMIASWQHDQWRGRLSGVTLTNKILNRPVGWNRIPKIALNMMIVDLLRTMINRLFLKWSVCVECLCLVEQYSTLFGRWSTFKSQFCERMWTLYISSTHFFLVVPTRVHQIARQWRLSDFWSQNRVVSCGSIGLLLPQMDRIFNVAIRTIQLHKEVKPFMELAEGLLGIAW